MLSLASEASASALKYLSIGNQESILKVTWICVHDGLCLAVESVSAQRSEVCKSDVYLQVWATLGRRPTVPIVMASITQVGSNYDILQFWVHIVNTMQWEYSGKESI